MELGTPEPAPAADVPGRAADGVADGAAGVLNGDVSKGELKVVVVGRGGKGVLRTGALEGVGPTSNSVVGVASGATGTAARMGVAGDSSARGTAGVQVGKGVVVGVEEATA